MTRKPSNHKNGLNFFNDRYFQSADFNKRSFLMYRDWITSIAISRFKWVNLPKGCDARFLEWTLLTQGVATIAFPKKMKGQFFSTMAMIESPINVYDNPTKWASYGNNGWRFRVTRANGVLVWDNLQRLPIYSQIDLFARRLAAFDRTLDINLQCQHTPYIITAAQEQRNDVVQLMKQIGGGEPAIIGTKGLRELTDELGVVNLEVPFIGEQLQSAKNTLWDSVYRFLGINSLPQKSERMIESEVLAQSEPTEMRALDSLNARRMACDELNERFANYLEEPIQVVWNKDVRTNNYNFVYDLRSQLEVEDGLG